MFVFSKYFSKNFAGQDSDETREMQMICPSLLYVDRFLILVPEFPNVTRLFLDILFLSKVICLCVKILKNLANMKGKIVDLVSLHFCSEFLN